MYTGPFITNAGFVLATLLIKQKSISVEELSADSSAAKIDALIACVAGGMARAKKSFRGVTLLRDVISFNQ